MDEIIANFCNAHEIVEEENPLSNDADESNVEERLSTALTALKENMSNTENRLHIRRTKLWDDHLHARKSLKWFK